MSNDAASQIVRRQFHTSSSDHALPPPVDEFFRWRWGEEAWMLLGLPAGDASRALDSGTVEDSLMVAFMTEASCATGDSDDEFDIMCEIAVGSV